MAGVGARLLGRLDRLAAATATGRLTTAATRAGSQRSRTDSKDQPNCRLEILRFHVALLFCGRACDFRMKSIARPARFEIQAGRRVVYVRPDEIEFVRAHFNHIELQVGDRALAMRRSLRWIEDQLDPQRFVRVHRSTLVRIDAIRHVQSLGSGRYSIRLENGPQPRRGTRLRAAAAEGASRRRSRVTAVRCRVAATDSGPGANETSRSASVPAIYGKPSAPSGESPKHQGLGLSRIGAVR